jgi:iron complex transport system substrate-binding protein
LLYLLGEQDCIVGVSGFSKRPPEVRTKPRVSTFRDANFEAIEKLDPDLIITYSDVQAEITKEAIRARIIRSQRGSNFFDPGA